MNQLYHITGSMHLLHDTGFDLASSTAVSVSTVCRRGTGAWQPAGVPMQLP